MSDLDDVIVSECESCNTRSEAVNSANEYETPLCPECIDIWGSEYEDDDLTECASCGSRVNGLHSYLDMYDVCRQCLDNHDAAEESIS